MINKLFGHCHLLLHAISKSVPVVFWMLFAIPQIVFGDSGGSDGSVQGEGTAQNRLLLLKHLLVLTTRLW